MFVILLELSGSGHDQSEEAPNRSKIPERVGRGLCGAKKLLLLLLFFLFSLRTRDPPGGALAEGLSQRLLRRALAKVSRAWARAHGLSRTRSA